VPPGAPLTLPPRQRALTPPPPGAPGGGCWGRLKELRSECNSACKKAGFPVGRKDDGFTFQNTRQSCLTNLAAAGTPDTKYP